MKCSTESSSSGQSWWRATQHETHSRWRECLQTLRCCYRSIRNSVIDRMMIVFINIIHLELVLPTCRNATVAMGIWSGGENLIVFQIMISNFFLPKDILLWPHASLAVIRMQRSSQPINHNLFVPYSFTPSENLQQKLPWSSNLKAHSQTVLLYFYNNTQEL